MYIEDIKGTNLLKYLFSLNRRNIKPGLERTKILLELLGNPQIVLMQYILQELMGREVLLLLLHQY